MNATELREHLRDATDRLDVPPDFAHAVLRGGRRRRARRRLTVAASMVAVAAVAATATVVTLREDGPVPVADARLTAPTRGDLASDQAFLDEALRAWQEGLPRAPEARDRYYDDERGAPHVYWAGNTPAGRAAIVLQQVFVHPNSQVTEKGLRTAEGLVAIDPADGRLKVVGTKVIGSETPHRADFYMFGPGDRTMLAVDHGEPLHYAFAVEPLRKDDGSWAFRIDWRRAEPDDGVAFATAPANFSSLAAVVYEGSDPPEVLDGDDVPFVRSTASHYLSMRLPSPSFRLDSTLLEWGETTWELGEPAGMTRETADSRWGFSRYYVGDPDVVVSLWTIVARLPDDRVVILKEKQTGVSGPRLVARVATNPAATTTELVDGGLVDRNALLPVRFRIPDGGGWIVADKGEQLSYRMGPAEPWQAAGKDAALLPEGANEVLVGDLYVRLS